MDLNAYLAPLRRWWWLLLVSAVLATISSYLITRQQPPVFQTRATLVIGRAVYEANPTTNDLWLGQQLASFYSDIGGRDQVREATMKALGLTFLPKYIVHPLPNSQLLEIVVTDNIPVRAQAVANELANQLIQQTPGANQSQNQEQQQFIKDQISYLQEKINETLTDIDTAEKKLANLNSARQISDTQYEIATLQSKLSQLQSNYTALLANSQQGANNTLSIIEQAGLPTTPIGAKKGVIILLSVAIALVVATGSAYLMEFLDDTLKSPEEITRLLNIPVIGHISEMSQGSSGGLYVAENPRSVTAEAFRALRINLEFVAVDKPMRKILVTSSSSFEGKTSVATNLAIVMAQGGKRVILVDADLRRPNIHRQFNVSNRAGLTDIFRGGLTIPEVLQNWSDENLQFITTGSLPPNPVDLLSSQKMDTILRQLEDMADVIIIDGPPLLVPDAVVLSTKVDGTLMVVKHSVTRKYAAKVGQEQLKRVGAHIIGIVINKIPSTNQEYYSRYRTYGYYSETEEAESKDYPDIEGISIFSRIFKKKGEKKVNSISNDNWVEKM